MKKSLKTINKDWNKLKNLMIKLDKEIQEIIESEDRNTPYTISDDFKKAVISALVELAIKYREGFSSLNSYWTSAREIRDTIESKKLFDLTICESKNIWIDIGFVLAELGFIEVKRSSSGNERRINIGHLEEITGLKLAREDYNNITGYNFCPAPDK